MADQSKPPRAAPRAPDPPKPALTPAEREARMMSTLTNSVFILTVLACMATVHWLRDLLNPLMVAVFSLILIDAMARNVGRFAPAIPEWARVGIAFIVISLVLVGAGALVVHSLPRFAADMVDAANQGQQLGAQATAQFDLPPFARFDQLNLRPYFSDLLSSLRQTATDLILVLIYLGFLLASRRMFDHKVQLLFPTTKSREHAQRVFRRVRKGAEGYVLLQAFKGLMLGSIFWMILRVFGVHNAIFLSFLVFLASFIPIVGPAASVLIPVVLALAQFGFGWRPVLLFISLQAVVVIAIASETPRIRWLAVVLSKKGDGVIPG